MTSNRSKEENILPVETRAMTVHVPGPGTAPREAECCGKRWPAEQGGWGRGQFLEVNFLQEDGPGWIAQVKSSRGPKSKVKDKFSDQVGRQARSTPLPPPILSPLGRNYILVS